MAPTKKLMRLKEEMRMINMLEKDKLAEWFVCLLLAELHSL